MKRSVRSGPFNYSRLGVFEVFLGFFFFEIYSNVLYLHIYTVQVLNIYIYKDKGNLRHLDPNILIIVDSEIILLWKTALVYPVGRWSARLCSNTGRYTELCDLAKRSTRIDLAYWRAIYIHIYQWEK